MEAPRPAQSCCHLQTSGTCAHFQSALQQNATVTLNGNHEKLSLNCPLDQRPNILDVAVDAERILRIAEKKRANSFALKFELLAMQFFVYCSMFFRLRSLRICDTPPRSSRH